MRAHAAYGINTHVVCPPVFCAAQSRPIAPPRASLKARFSLAFMPLLVELLIHICQALPMMSAAQVVVTE